MDDHDLTEMAAATSEACDAFMREMGETYPWLHPDYDPRDPWWARRANEARARDRRRRR